MMGGGQEGGKIRLDEKHSPGCMWGLLHQFHRNGWLTAASKKRLPRKRITNNALPRTSPSAPDGENNTTFPELQEKMDSFVEKTAVETKSKDPSATNKSSNSMKSRIRALITQDMTKKKGRHRRISSYPDRTPIDTTIADHNLESSSDTESSSPRHNTPDTNNINNVALDCHKNLLKEGQEHSRSTSCEWCAAMLNMHYLTQTDVNKLWKHPVRDHTLLQDKCIYAIEPGKFTSHLESKLFMDALDLLNMRKEVFLKILKDPTSSLAHQLRHRRTPSHSRIGLKKSISFPASSSSAGKSLLHKDNEDKSQDPNNDPTTSNGSTSTENVDHQDNALSTSANVLKKKKNSNKAAQKHFKNLKDKLKYVIRDRKREKNRIVMDAVHHKIPYGHSLNDDTPHMPNAEAKASKYSPRSDFGSTSFQSIKRTSSFNDSLDKYNRLLEISMNKEVKNNVSDRLRAFTSSETSTLAPRNRPATLVRILSLPDLRTYSSFHIDDSPSHNCFHTPDVEPKAQSVCETKSVQTSGGVSESGSRENLLDTGEIFDGSVDSRMWETADSSHDFNDVEVPAVQSSDHQPSQSDQVTENYDAKYHENDVGQELGPEDSKDGPARQEDTTNLDNCINISDKNNNNNNTLETQVKQLYDALLHIPIDAENAVEFNYVKDVLELSGFTRDEILGKWHAAGTPLDPMMFEEVVDCPVPNNNEQGRGGGGIGIYDHLLLFDLINEVLLDIYERSCCYWPRPLVTRCRVHKMPKGYRVLEEVWAEISWSLSWRPEFNQTTIDDVVCRDLGKNNGWMNLQIEGENVGLELEEWIFDDLLEEIVST